ncbi:hypothetical protein [Mammaliicoccus vitulinus]|uniref:hypothetical protein n=1 Tax=Mammaliicoccus vitulinus TaxID=71237 RepID=UPI00248BAF8C|nr:hypothetical protein [Mammaliicoccus vitulinus]
MNEKEKLNNVEDKPKKKESLLNKSNTNRPIDNSLINTNQKLDQIPDTSLRVSGNTHSMLSVIKKEEMTETIDDIINDAISLYMKKYSKDKFEYLQKQIEFENDYKIKKIRKKENRRK